MVEANNRNWFVVQTKPRNERKVEQQIIARDIEVFLPLITSIRYWSDRKKKIQVPLFSGYLFVHATEEERVLAIKNNVGALRYLFYEKRPARLTEEEINNIILSLKEPERVKVERSSVCKGDLVMITRGAFAGMKGLVTEIRGNYKLTVNIYELSMSLNIVLNPNEVELLKNIE